MAQSAENTSSSASGMSDAGVGAQAAAQGAGANAQVSAAQSGARANAQAGAQQPSAAQPSTHQPQVVQQHQVSKRAQAVASGTSQVGKHRAARKSRRAHKHVRQKGETRTIVLKIVAVALLLVICGLGAFMIGDSDYNATMVGWVPFVALICAIALAFLYLCILRDGLEISESAAIGSCKKGEDVVIATTFKNKRPLFYFCIKVLIFISDNQGRPLTNINTTLALSPKAQYTMEFKVRFDHVGTYSAGVYEVTICDFLRLFTHHIPASKQTQVQVTPRIVPIRRITYSNDASLEAQKARQATLADSLDYAYVREYVPGDPLKTIHWKISARSENYMTRLFEVHNNPGVAVLMDFYAETEDAEALMSMFDAVVESAFSLANYSREQGMDTEIHFVNKYGERCRRLVWGGKDGQAIVEELPPMKKDAIHSNESLELLRTLILSQNGQNNLVVCTADLSSEMVSLLIEAKGRKRNPILIAALPPGLIGRERDSYCACLGRLSTANIGYVALEVADELGEVNV